MSNSVKDFCGNWYCLVDRSQEEFNPFDINYDQHWHMSISEDDGRFVISGTVIERKVPYEDRTHHWGSTNCEIHEHNTVLAANIMMRRSLGAILRKGML
jgi:hypothetical protein